MNVAIHDGRDTVTSDMHSRLYSGWPQRLSLFIAEFALLVIDDKFKCHIPVASLSYHVLLLLTIRHYRTRDSPFYWSISKKLCMTAHTIRKVP